MRVRWVFDEHKRKKYISIDQKLSVSELEEIIILKHLKDTGLCDKQLHNAEHSFRLGTVFPGWHRPQLLQLLVTARSFISFADGSAMMRLRCVCGL